MKAIRPSPLSDADPLCRMTAQALFEAFAKRRLSPVDVVSAVLDRAETIDARFKAFTLIDRAGALRQARESEARWRRRAPLSAHDGVPATIKDLVHVEGWPIRCGSLTTPTTACATDAPAVARLRAAGVVFLGLTTLPEFGWKTTTDSPLSGITRNPWNPEMTPGGSSGGAAVAAATGAGVFHLGTDGGGSIRVPAAFTGIVGLKPSFGRVPAFPASAFGTLAHLGPMARCVADARAMLHIMSGDHPADWLQGQSGLPPLDDEIRDLDGLRIGYWSKPPAGRIDPEIAAMTDAVVAILGRRGARVIPVALPGVDLTRTFAVLWSAGAAARVAALPDAERGRLDPGLRDLAAAGARLGAVDYLEAQAARVGFGAAMDALLSKVDILVSPATAYPAFPVGHVVPPGSGLESWFDGASFSFPINLSQQPACTVPCGQTRDGLPIGLQIVGPRGADSAVLAYAAAFERSFPDFFL